jgi:hypothetical protein
VPPLPLDSRAKLGDSRLPAFLEQQLQQCGGNVEIEPAGLWLLFIIEEKDTETNALVRALLADVNFHHDSGVSADDQWTLYYVDTDNRPAALHWLHDLQKRVAGEIRPLAAEHRALIRELARSPMPHRLAQQLADLHVRDELAAGCIEDRAIIRALLDRWHVCGPLALPAFRTLLAHHLIDLVVLLQELHPEDLEVLSDILRDELSSDPVAQHRREGATEIRRLLTRFHVINSLDQQSNNAIENPYAAFVDIACNDERVVVPVDGAMVRLLREHFSLAIRATRRRLYAGAEFEKLSTMDPWVTDAMALPFRFLKQRLALRRDLSPMDWLYIAERAI